MPEVQDRGYFAIEHDLVQQWRRRERRLGDILQIGADRSHGIGPQHQPAFIDGAAGDADLTAAQITDGFDP